MMTHGAKNIGMGGHQSARMMKDEWLTPPNILSSLGDFDLDPCAPVVRPWETADYHYTINEDGLSKEWHGRVWLNPPYGRSTGKWLHKLASHGNGIALIFARTETKIFFDYVWNKASAVLFIKGRLHFHHVDGSMSEGNAGAPSCLVAYGEDNVAELYSSCIDGQIIHL